MFIYKKEFKRLAYFLLVGMLVFPLAVGAQIKAPSDGNAAGSSSILLVIVENIAEWLLGAAGIIGAIGLIIAVILWMTAAGELDRISKAKDVLVNSLIGIAVSIAGLVILNLIRVYVRQ